MPGLTVKYLRCEYKVNPAGIDTNKPRLTWITETGSNAETNLKQTSYRIVVSSSGNGINNNVADIWDSGRVLSDQNFQVELNGKELQSAKKYWWKVKVWSEDIESDWSEPAEFITGILHKNEWLAQWIGFDEYELERQDKIRFKFSSGDKWIWVNHDKYTPPQKYNKVLFRYDFIIRSGSDLDDVFLLVTADEGFKFFLNDALAAESDGKIFSWARPVFTSIKHLIRSGTNKIYVECINSYLDKPGFTAKIFVLFHNGNNEIIKTKEDWEASHVGDDKLFQWGKAEVIAEMGDKPWRIPHHELILPPPPYMRKEFSVENRVKNAFLFISALGIVKPYLNSSGISEDKFIPGWTDYNKRVHYKVYDIKELLLKNNCIGVILADGWYAGYIGWEKHRGYYGEHPRCLVQIMIEYEDGANRCIVSDETWNAAYGSLREADILMGETYDASLENEMLGWNSFGYNDLGWTNVISEKKTLELNSYPGEPVKAMMEIKPVNITSPQRDVYIFDLGQNIAGNVRIKIDGRKTEAVKARFGEMLNDKGELYTENIRMARSEDTYRTKGFPKEIWQPEFTYHGFRYIELTGYTEIPDVNTITGIVMHSELPVTGHFRCSNEKLNRLYESIIWNQRANYFDIPTDCPQRDERLGWTADAIDFFKTAAYNMDVSAFYTKWLRDLNDAQLPDGAYTAIAPQPDLGVGPLFAGAAGWADAGIITPYYLYQFYGDKHILKRYYSKMLRYMKYLEVNSKDCIRPNDGYGDWLSINADTPKDLIATAFYAYDAKIMSEISGHLNKHEDKQKFNLLYEKIRRAFIKEYVLPDHTFRNWTQTACALTLSFELLDEHDKAKAIEELVNNIRRRDHHISAGFIGLHFILPLLTKYGYTDTAFKVLLNESFPSWINMLNNGATTLWERWDSYSPDKGIYDPLMNSFNHTSLGVAGEWLYSVIGGISPLEPGFKKIKIQPEPGGSLTFADTSYQSLSGRISTSWKYEDHIFTLKVIIPFNTIAKVCLLKKYGSLIQTEPVCISTETEDRYNFTVGSGEYMFVQKQ